MRTRMWDTYNQNRKEGLIIRIRKRDTYHQSQKGTIDIFETNDEEGRLGESQEISNLVGTEESRRPQV